jgi:pimeloyl-ACP methyl ester carboxylesterase
VIDEVSSEFRLIAPDFPGFGDSEKPPQSRFAYDVGAFAEVVADLFAGLDIGRAAVVGHALGGAVFHARGTSPEPVSRLVLSIRCFMRPVDLGCASRLPVSAARPGQPGDARCFDPSLQRGAVGPGGVPAERIDGYYDAFDDPTSRESARCCGHPRHRPIEAQTARIQAPTLVVWGRDDRIVPARFGQRLSRQIRGAGFELMDTGHAPHEQRPAEFAAILGRFLRAERPSGDRSGLNLGTPPGTSSAR